MHGGKSDVVSCRHVQRSHPATSATKRGPEKCRDELIHLQNYPRPCIAIQTCDSGSVRGTAVSQVRD